MPSSVIASFDYDPTTSILTIKYLSGMVYEYLHVPESTYQSLKKSRSKGTYLNKFIKGKFTYRKVS